MKIDINVGDWGLGLVIEIGDRGFRLRIGDWDWGLGIGLELGIGLGD